MPLSICGENTNSKKRELKQHGTMLFPAACYEENLALNPVPWHWHEEFEVIVIKHGVVNINVANERLQLKQGEGIFINAGVLHSASSFSKETDCLCSIVFHPRLVGGNMDSIFWQKLIHPVIQDASLRYYKFNCATSWQQDAIESVQAAWKAIVYEEEEYEIAARYFISHVMYLLTSNYSIKQRQLTEQEQLTAARIKLMLQYIEEHFMEELSIEAIANRVAVSHSVCLRCFQQVIGTSPMQYVKQLRIEKAAEMLLTTSKTAGTISSECGFSDTSYFTKTFRELKRATPIQYRKTYKI